MAEIVNPVQVQGGEVKALVEPIPFKAEPKSVAEQGGEVLLITVALLVVTTIVLMWLRKKFGLSRNAAGVPASERLSVIEKVGIGAQSSILVVSWRNKEYLLAYTANMVAKIDEYSVGVSPEQPECRPE